MSELNLTEFETEAMVRAIEPDLLRYADLYDKDKYPPAELVRLRTAFGTSELVDEPDIGAALVWKYGHTGKRNYPEHHRALAARIAERWADAMLPPYEPLDCFGRWRTILGPTSFITVCFLLHLVKPRDLPILDQHNYRAVTHHLAGVRPDLGRKMKPSQFGDLLLVRDFSVAVLDGWERYGHSMKPTDDILDHYFMMYGKALESQRAREKTAVQDRCGSEKSRAAATEMGST